MQIKFGPIWGNALTLSHFEKKARRNTDLAASVNHVSRPFGAIDLASPTASHDASNCVLSLIFEVA